MAQEQIAGLSLLPYALAGIGGVTLLAALAMSRRSHAAPPQSLQTTLNTGEGQSALAQSQVPGADRASPSISPQDDIEWQESGDVYAPTPVLAATFVQTLPLARFPALLPQQTYIFLRAVTLETINAHLKQNLDVEQGGLLIGRVYVDATLQTYLLIIEEALPAPDGVETPTFFGYTAASWRALTPHLQQLSADSTILGSYHSHPNMGVFLSETDLETQETVFSHDWQIALVIDPVRDETGFFVGESGQPCANWYFLQS